MTFAPDRDASRRDWLLFTACLLLSVIARFMPAQYGVEVGRAFRETLLRPLLALQHQTELTKTARARFALVEGQRDSFALAADSLAAVRLENNQLRALLGLRGRLPVSHVAAEILRQSGPGEGLLVLSAGKQQGVREFDPVVAPEGLVGVISKADARTSIMMLWTNSEFRASAMTEDGAVFGIVSPGAAAGPNETLMSLSGVPYREQVAPGTPVYTSGLGGVFPRGISLGRVLALGAEGEGWSRTYVVQPAVHPASVSHVIILTGETADLRAPFRRDAQ